MDKLVTATGFSLDLGSLPNLPVSNVLYDYDTADGDTIILESNNSIYLGDQMQDSLMNPIQAEENGTKIDLRPSRYYPNDWSAQKMTFDDGTVIPIQYDGVLPYLPIRRPTKS